MSENEKKVFENIDSSKINEINNINESEVTEDPIIAESSKSQSGHITNKPDQITKKDVTRAWTRWWFANEIPHAFDKYLSPSLTWGLTPIIKKLYKTDEERAKAYERHLLFFNTQLTWGGGICTGITASLEQTRANEVAEGKELTVTDDLIYNTKTGLMGPLAGIGDAIDSGTIQYIFIAIAIPWAQQGKAIGALFPFVAFALYQYFLGYYFTHLGFRLGRQAADEIMGSNVKYILNGLSILGLFMMGVLAAQYVNVSSSLSFDISGKEFVIQEILDGVIPGLLPLATVMGVYFYFKKKGLKVTNALLGLTVILAVLAIVGIL